MHACRPFLFPFFFPFPSFFIFSRCFFPSSQDKMANCASGMAVNDECKLKFQELKSKRNYRYITFKIEEQQVIVDKVGRPEDSYDKFTSSECRYAVYDFDFTTNENVQKSRIIFVAWSPETSVVRNKMESKLSSKQLMPVK